MMKVETQVFMGNGDFSLAQMGHLYNLLSRGFDLLGEMQQAPTCHESEEVHEKHLNTIGDCQYELELIAKEIGMGLTGKRSVFREL